MEEKKMKRIRLQDIKAHFSVFDVRSPISTVPGKGLSLTIEIPA